MLTDCQKLVGNHIERAAERNTATSLADLAGKPVRLRFQLKDAEVYSLRFAI